MKKIHVLGIMVLTMLALGVVSIASASALEWLEDGLAMTAAKASEATGEIKIRNTNGGGLGLNFEILCSVTFVGSVGPGAADEVTSIKELTGASVTLAAPVSCTNVANCGAPLVSAVNLPWKTKLATVGALFVDTIEGTPGWEFDCVTVFGLIEETCTGPVKTDLVNDAAENDVLGEFNEAEIIANGEQALCTGGNTKTGTVNSDGAALLFLTNGLTLAVS